MLWAVFYGRFNTFSFLFLLAWSFVTVGVRPTDCCESRPSTAAVVAQRAEHVSEPPLQPAGGFYCLILTTQVIAAFLCVYSVSIPLYNNICTFYSAFQFTEHAVLSEYKMHQFYFYRNVSEEQEVLISSFHRCIFLPAVPILILLFLFPSSPSMLVLKLSKKKGQYIRDPRARWVADTRSYIPHMRLTPEPLTPLTPRPQHIAAHLWVQEIEMLVQICEKCAWKQQCVKTFLSMPD